VNTNREEYDGHIIGIRMTNIIGIRKSIASGKDHPGQAGFSPAHKTGVSTIEASGELSDTAK